MESNQAQTLTLVQFNVENLFIFLDQLNNQMLDKINESEWQKLSSSTTQNKPLRKVQQLASIIMAMQPDILMLNEVGGLESLQNFNHYFLNDMFSPHLIEGNSRRGIDVGYLIKKDLPYRPLLITHKDRPIDFLYPHESQTPSGGKSHYFSRDVAELRLFKENSTTPSLVILLVHLKSKLDSEKIDNAGKLRRAAELKCLIKIYNEIREELGPDIGVLVSGDFNGGAAQYNLEPEFETLHQTSDLVDLLDWAGVAIEKRFTQIQIHSGGRTIPLQLDYIFASPNLLPRMDRADIAVQHFSIQEPFEISIPKNMEERNLLPSDHYPMIVKLKI